MLALKPASKGRRLAMSFVREARSRVSASENARAENVKSMADEKEGRHPSDPVQFAPSINFRVRSRASLSENCCGGDFMK